MPILLNVDAAIESILKTIERLGSESIALHEARGRTLAQTVASVSDLPPFANSAVDGYAVRARDIEDVTEDNSVTLVVAMDIPAGTVASRPLEKGEAARIMTGAPVPDGADCVVMVEDTSSWHERNWLELADMITIYKTGHIGQNIRPIGENVKSGEIILEDGDELNAAGIGMLAALGMGTVAVVKRPRIVILSSGDELVGVDEPLTAGKIRDVNSYTLRAMCEAMGAEAISIPRAQDTLESVRQMFVDALALKPDAIVSSAGVSVGAADFIRDILEEMGEVNLWRINLRPGKPLAYGHVGGVPFFGLPGNPVSAMVTFEVIVRPALAKMMGYELEDDYVEAYTAHAMQSDGRRSYIRVNLERRGKRLYASETGTQSSGALLSMVKADGLLIIPEDVKYVTEGQLLKVKLLKRKRILSS